MTDDARDLTAARAGDHQAFARLYDRHAAVVFSLCRSHSGDDGEDAVQETFIRAYQRLAQLDGPDQLRPWLYAIARRVCAERRRAASRRRNHEGVAGMIQTAQFIAPETADHTADRAEQLVRLTDAIESLPDDERLAVHLFYLENDPVSAGASALGLSRSGFYKLLARARKTLARHMREVSTR